MKILKLKFEDFYLIKPKIFKDKRGTFRRHLCIKTLKKHGININVAQGNISESKKKGTLRGFHFKDKPSSEYKILSCLRGSIHHVAVDLRKNSKTYKKNFSINLYSKNRYSLIIPPLCANAFLTLQDNSMIHYYMGDYFDNKKYKGFRYDDPSFKIKWPFKPIVINKRDKGYKDFKFE